MVFVSHILFKQWIRYYGYFFSPLNQIQYCDKSSHTNWHERISSFVRGVVFFFMYIIELDAVYSHCLISFQVLGGNTVFYIHAVCACICVRSTLCSRGSYEQQTCNEYLILKRFFYAYKYQCDFFMDFLLFHFTVEMICLLLTGRFLHGLLK